MNGRPPACLRSREPGVCHARALRSDSVSQVIGYEVSVGTRTVQVETFREAGYVVMEALTDFLAQDPEAAAEGVMMANRAFSVGTVKYAVDTYGSWRTSLTVRGEPVTVKVVKVDRGDSSSLRKVPVLRVHRLLYLPGMS